jgi:hypothetical protein
MAPGVWPNVQLIPQPMAVRQLSQLPHGITMTEPQLQNWSYTPIPNDAVPLFRLSWQLENWLRIMVYVELRANQINWELPIQEKVSDWPPPSLENDKRLHHMATSHQVSLSFLTFGQLWEVIAAPSHWRLFAPYFPPKANTDARIAEVKAIRNRIAHFREPHVNDLARLELFMKDMEPGIRRFCSRYTTEKVPVDPREDVVSQRLEQDWEHVGYGIELRRPHGWLYASGAQRARPRMNARLAMLFHRSFTPGSLRGVIYRLSIQSGNDSRGPVDAEGIFNATKPIHSDIIHIMLAANGEELSVTVPAILGAERVGQVVGSFLRAGLDAAYRWVTGRPDREKLQWPEYVLWPDHMLTIFFEEMQESTIEFPLP